MFFSLSFLSAPARLLLGGGRNVGNVCRTPEVPPNVFYPFKLCPISPLVRKTHYGIFGCGCCAHVIFYAAIMFYSGMLNGIPFLMASDFLARLSRD
jgi:hypothetical protein